MADKKEWTTTEIAVFDLDTRDRFLYEYGRFLVEWNSFEFYVEALIWYIKAKIQHHELSCTQNFRDINRKSTVEKRAALEECLRSNNKKDVLDAVSDVYYRADRNKWIHGRVLEIMVEEPDEYRDAEWRLFRLNWVNKKPKIVEIEGMATVFEGFYDSLFHFKSTADKSFGWLTDVSNYYLLALVEEGELKFE